MHKEELQTVNQQEAGFCLKSSIELYSRKQGSYGLRGTLLNFLAVPLCDQLPLNLSLTVHCKIELIV